MRYGFIVNSALMVAIVILSVFLSWIVAREETPIFTSSVTFQVVLQSGEYDSAEGVMAGASYVAKDLSRAVYTDDFLRMISKEKFNIRDERLFDSSIKNRTWKSIVSSTSEGSFVRVDISHPNKQDARALISAVVQVMTKYHPKWYSRGVTGIVRVVEGPTVLSKPYRKREFATLVGGLSIGILVGGSFLVKLMMDRRARFNSENYDAVKEKTLTIIAERVYIQKNTQKPSNDNDYNMRRDVSPKENKSIESNDLNARANREFPLKDNRPLSEFVESGRVFKPEPMPVLQTGILPMSDPNKEPSSNINQSGKIRTYRDESNANPGAVVPEIVGSEKEESNSGKFYYMGQIVD